jgi:hypothetical protein
LPQQGAGHRLRAYGGIKALTHRVVKVQHLALGQNPIRALERGGDQKGREIPTRLVSCSL